LEVRRSSKEFNFEILLNDVTLFGMKHVLVQIQKGKIGIGYTGEQPLNVYVDEWLRFRRRRSGDMFDIYLQASESTFFTISLCKG
jgi:predicted secreted hydrolase